VSSIEDILARARPVERVVPVCLRGDLLAEWDSLEHQLATVGESGDEGSLGTLSPSKRIALRMAELREEMASETVDFRLRGMSPQALSDLQAEHPARQGREAKEAWNPETFSVALVAACAVDPEMTVEQTQALFVTLNRSQRNDLFNGAWEASTGSVSIPFSERASEILRNTAAK